MKKFRLRVYHDDEESMKIALQNSLKSKCNNEFIIKTSWYCAISVFIWFNMVTSPLLILWPELNDEGTMKNLLWLNELAFALDILRKFIDKPKKSRAVDTYEIAIAYIKSTFVFDVIATLPQVASGLNQKFLPFKIVRLFNYLWALHYPFEALVQICYSDKDQRHNFVVTDAYRTLCRIVMLLHYLAIIWIWLGSPAFSGYEQDYEPW